MLEELFGGQAVWFAVPALLGTGVFAIRIVLMLVGVDHSADHAGSDAHADGSIAFEILSLQGIAALVMGFGWAGLAAMVPGRQSLLVSMVLGIVAGIGTVWVVGLGMSRVRRLETSGNLPHTAMVGEEGVVYSVVPGSGRGLGQVTMVVRGVQRTVNAVTAGSELARHARVRVVRANPDNTLTVEPVG